MLNARADCEVTVEARSGHDLQAQLENNPVDLIFLDHSMPDGSGLEFLAKLGNSPGTPRVILLSATSSATVYQQALHLGAAAVISKGTSTDVLEAAMAATSGNGTYVDPAIAANLAGANQLSTLTGREMQVLLLILEGLATKAIAAQLNVSFKTAETHRTNLMSKLEIHSIGQLMQKAVGWGLIGDQIL